MPRIILSLAIIAVMFCGPAAAQTTAGQVEFRKCWQYGDGQSRYVALSSDERAAFVSTEDAKVSALAIDTGEKLWSSELGGSAISNLVVAADRLYLVALSGEGAGANVALKILSKQTGIAVKSIPLANAERYYSEAHEGSLVLASANGDIYSIDTAVHEIRWHRKPTGAIVGQPHIGASTVTVASADNTLLRLNTKTGEIDYTKKAESSPTVVFSTIDGNVFYGDGVGRFSSVTGKWTLRLGARVSSVSEVGESLIVSSFDNFVYRIDPDSGDVRWRKRLGGRVAGTAVTAERSLLIFTLGETNAVLTDFSKGKTVGQLTLAEAVEAAVIPPKFSSGSVISINGEIFSYATGLCDTKKASAAFTDASSVIR